MAQDYTIAWVGDQPRYWNNFHGDFADYYIALDGREGTAKLTQKAGTPPPAVGQNLYGDIVTESFTNKATGEPFTRDKFKKQKRPDGYTPPANGSGRVLPSIPGEPTKDDAWWYAKDRRISRAGILQAVVASGRGPDSAATEAFVEFVNGLTDALLASLDERTPHPSAPSEQTSLGVGIDKPVTDLPVSADDVAPAAPPVSVVQTRASQLNPERWLLELASFGEDISNPQEAIAALSDGQRAVFAAKLEEIAREQKQAVATLSSDLSDDDDVPF